MTGNDYIASALRLIGALASGESPTAAESNDCLMIFQQLLDSWQAERLNIFQITRSVQIPATLKQTYTLGLGGDFNIARPPRVQRIGVINQPTAAQPVELDLASLNESQWLAIPVKNTQGALPLEYWNDGSFPLMNINFWPIPSVLVYFALYYWTLLTSPPDFVTDIEFPPAYARAIRYNLAVDLMAEFPGNPEKYPMVMKIASESKLAIKSFNAPNPIMKSDPAMVQGGADIYNWQTDQPAGRS